METSILGLLQGENRTIAWLFAVVLAAGGTGVVVAVYLQWQRWRRIGVGQALQHRFGARRSGKPVEARPGAQTAAPVPQVRPAVQGVAAYRAVQQTAAPAAEPVADPVLDQLLSRLHAAAGRLEDAAAAVRSVGRQEDEASAMEFDVEFVHRHA